MKVLTTAPTPIEWGVITFGCWHSIDLIDAWQNSPKDRGGVYLFGLWILPFIIACFQDKGFSSSLTPFRTRLAICSVGAILAGSMGDLNAISYAGLAFALTAGTWEFAPRRAILWLICSISWMPAFSYLTHSLPDYPMLGIKLGMVMCSTTAMMLRMPRTSSP